MSSNRSKRLRKKLYLDEFAIFGFEFECDLSCTDTEEFDKFMNDIIDYIESKNLNIGGGGNLNSFGGFICSNKRYESVTKEDINNLKSWLSNHQLVSNIKIGQLVDANYGI